MPKTQAPLSSERDLLIELRTTTTEVLRRMDNIDLQLVPRKEYEEKVMSLGLAHATNQVEIEHMQVQLNALIWKIGGGLGSLQVITALVLYLITSR